MYVCKMLNIEIKFNQTLALFCFTIVVVVFDIFSLFLSDFFQLFSNTHTHTRSNKFIRHNIRSRITFSGKVFCFDFSSANTVSLLSLWLKMFHRYAKSHRNCSKNKNFGCILCVFSFHFLAVVSLILHDSEDNDDDDNDDKETNYFRNGYKEFVCIISIHWLSFSVCLLAEKWHRMLFLLYSNHNSMTQLLCNHFT